MSIEIDILSGDAAWPMARPLLETVWPPGAKAPHRRGTSDDEHPTLRVLIESSGELVCHVGITIRIVTWNGRKCQVGGIGGLATRPDGRRRGYGSLALTAAVQTLRDHEAIDCGLAFCDETQAAFFEARGWQRYDGAIVAEQSGSKAPYDELVPMQLDLRRKVRGGTLDLCGSPW
ncbi:GNAT family N-acetyltransferase [Rhodopseudomonas sp. HC1]|uniref:GNAT family N-acetyltransferase n=1 Tax=Rhodopseudomonas infernalis TaxID=2897386 RepID=UPI001EE8D28C|nr:GNAT family N-acetyltransferase [Rhodopseudomonas infernalis]MCG6206264.1 GNAT family N-acetyltransferase [Rhodopseudomonas infernalis]